MQRKWKRRWQRLTKAILPPVAAGLLFLSAYSPALANPANGTVVSGSATISNSGATMTVNQTTDKTIINWQSFSIGKGETVNFVQPGSTSVALNRVVGSDASSIYGSLNANGKVYLINPNGVLFAPGSSVNVGGLVASTLNISDSDFLSGNYTFQKGGSAGSVANQGTITATNEAVLIGPQVANEGVIAAKVTGLAAGNKVSLDFSGDNLLNVAVDTGALNGSATNTGTITVTGGLAVMSAGTKDKLLNTVVNNSGVIRAQSVNNVNGVIRLEGNAVTNSGTLDASGRAAGQTGGTVKLLGDTVTVKTGSAIDVAGDAGGGTALIGGAWQGGDSEYAATNTTVESGAAITADAITSGNGGTVVVWANDTTKFAGTITARGGSVSGNGGSVETSGKQTLAIGDTAQVSTLAASGQTGNWLLDPYNLTIAYTANRNVDSTSGFTASGDDSVVNFATLQNALETTNVTVSTGSGGSQEGNITVAALLDWTSANTLTLSAANNIYLNNAITAANGGLTLAANTSSAGDGVTTGIIVPGCSINVGTFTLAGGTWREVSSSLSSFYAIDFRISGGTFIRATSGDGTSASPYQIADVYGLQGIDSAGMLGSYYTLANDIDASGTQYWNYDGSTYAGFVPIGTTSSGSFTGSFDGAGHTISGLIINQPSANYVGLFGDSGGTINNVGLIGGSVTGGYYTGGLVGVNSGSITDCYSTATVTGSNSVGGLVGLNSGSITDCYSTGTVTGSNYVGGLVGVHYSGSITNSYSTGAVAGGDNSYKIGGLVGTSNATIESSYSTGTVIGGDGSFYIGGLVGSNDGSITTSYSTGAVTGGSGSSDIGGLVGRLNAGSIKNSYSTGAVTGGDGSYNIGGLLGFNNGGIVTTSYSTGAVTGGDGSNYIGGLVGHNSGGITASYYATTDANGNTINSGSGYSSYGTGKTLAELTDLATFSGWDIAATGGSSAVWRIYSGYTTPLLRSFLTAVTVNATTAGKNYDGTAASGSNLTYTLSDPGVALSTGSTGLSYTTDGKDAGDYSTAGGTLTFNGLYSNQQGYDISYAPAALTITPKVITYSVADTNSTYGTLATAGAVTLTGLVQGDENAVSGTVQITDSANNAVPLAYNTAAGSYTESVNSLSGAASGNYVLAGSGNTTGTLTIAKKAITYSVADTTSTYGTLATAGAVTLTGLVQGDENAVSGTVQITDSANNAAILAYNTAAGNYTESVNSLSGAASGNYVLAGSGNTTGTLTIAKKAITYSVADTNSTYGTLATVGAVTLTGLVQGDENAVSGTVQITDSANNAVPLAYNTAAGSYTESVNSLSGAASGNYVLAGSGNTTGTLTIAKKAITYSVTDASGTYGTLATAGAVTLTGLVSGDAGVVTGTVALSDSSNNAVTLAYNTAAGNYTESVSGLSGTAAGNYELSASGNTNGTLTIAQKAITYSVADTNSTYGTLATAGAVTLTGLVQGDENAVSGTVQITDSANNAVTLAYNTAAGSYTESVNSLSGTATGNYELAASGNTTGTLTIAKKAITYSVADTTSTYGTQATAGAVTLTGLVSGDAGVVTGTVALSDRSNNAVTLAYNTAAGSYTESVSGLSGTAAGNYELSASGNTNGTLTIAKKAITYSVADTTSTYGTQATAGAVTLTGLVSGDIDAVTGTVALSDSSNNAVTLAYNTAAGSYTESVSGLSGTAAGNYELSASGNTNGTLTIAKKAITYSVADTTSTYGTLAAPAVTLTGLVSGDTDAVTGTVALSDSSNNAVTLAYNTAAGSYTESVNSLSGTAAGNYELSASGNTNGTLTIAKKAITYSVADTTSTYGTLAAPAVTLTGLVSGDTDAVTGTVALSDRSNNAVTLAYNTAAGSYIESVSGLSGTAAGNYELSASGNTNGTLTIAKKAITYSVADASGTYGTQATAGAVTLTGLVSGDAGAVTGTVALSDRSNNAVTLAYNTAAGSYTESVSGLSGTAAGNYELSASGNTKGTLTIAKKAITYSVADTTSTYGTLAAPAVTLTGLVSGDTDAVTGTVALSDRSNNAVTLAYNTAAGSYTESVNSLSGTAAGNYELSASGNTNGTLTIAKKAITYSVADTTSTYGTLAAPAVTLTGLVSGDTDAVTGTVALSDSSNNAVTLAYNTAAGSYTESVNSLSGTAAGNYELSASGNTNGTLTIAKKAITYSVADTTSTYGTLAAPAVTLTGLVSGDTDAVTGTVALSDSSNNAVTLAYNTAAGSYIESVSGLSGTAAGNYELSASGNTNGTLTIAKKAITYSVADASGTYGTQATAGAVTLTGLVSGDAGAVTGTVALSDRSNNAVTLAYNTAAGSYTESVSGLSGTAAGNYELSASGNTNGTLTIAKKAITYSVADASGTYGTQATAGAVTLTGLVSGDTDVVTGTVALSDRSNNAVTLAYNTAAGSYTESVSGLSGTAAGNYELSASGNTNGTLTIAKKAITYSVADASGTYGTQATAGAVTLTGLVSGDTDAVTGTVALSDSSNNAVTLAYNTAAGSYTESVSGLSGTAAGNYELSASGNTNGMLTIARADLTITASNQSKTYGKSLDLGTTAFGVNGLVTGDNVTSVVLTSGGADATAKAGKYVITAGGASGSGLGNYNIAYVDGVLTVQSLNNPAYDGAVIHADHMAAGLLGPLKPYSQPYGLGGASGYQADASGSVVPLTIIGTGINTGGYLLMSDTAQ